MSERLNKAQRLIVAGVVAPSLRGADDAGSRRVARVDKDGNVVGYTTLAEVRRALLYEHSIEIAVVGRPKETQCLHCGKPIAVKCKGKLPIQCRSNCNLQRNCGMSGCKLLVPDGALIAAEVRRRKGRPWLCPRHRKERKRDAAKVATASRAKRRAKHARARRRYLREEARREVGT